MNKAKSSWFVYTKRADFKAIAERFGIDQVTARILRNRGICTDEEIDYFLHAGTNELYDEMLLPDMGKAALILWQSVKEAKYIRIVGDYDIDGVCATYILLKGIREAGGRADYRIPDRIRDGYGINRSIVLEAIGAGVDLLLTCDNGIAAVDELKEAKDHGLTVIVTDHHNVRRDEKGTEILPPADAVVDVKRESSRYPHEDICGAVTAWKLIRALFRLAGLPDDRWLTYIDFAAIATIGDIMALKGENRIIVGEGLRIMNGGRQIADKNAYGSACLGLRTLIREYHLDDKQISAYHVGFILGPAINAGGRLETAESALRLFLTEDPEEAVQLARHLISLNEERKAMTEAGVEQGIEVVEHSSGNDKVLVVFIDGLHESLAGIVAGRLKEYYARPVIVVTRAQEGLKGSGRSIEAYNMFEGLCGAEGYLTKFGGHPMAAGLSLREEDLDAFRHLLNEQAKLSTEDFVHRIWIDAPMPIGYVTPKLIGELERLAPFGQGFERPVFAEKGLRASDFRILGKNRNVLRMRLKEDRGVQLDAIIFGDAEKMMEEIRQAETIDILYYPKINEYNGRRTIQIEIREYITH
ncbi:MAG: single-stranded-DNA-specific exonuclease RecJ [Lachnospiraceae bacterium]|nr:single-stranded-DNA-specific exonuclease RecJ [Lachnospiraceae bacterium]MBQ2040785.1 single-stranded-DNA-specific exonuclease RecJ [Lachnospiraceae bacterium]